LFTALLFAYPTSLGPWYWTVGRLGGASSFCETTKWLYAPLILAEQYLPQCIYGPYHGYCTQCAIDGMTTRYQEDY
jgi:hypothetical protein